MKMVDSGQESRDLEVFLSKNESFFLESRYNNKIICALQYKRLLQMHSTSMPLVALSNTRTVGLSFYKK